MRTYLLAPVFILLLALLPGCATKQSAPSWPWKEGDEVRAELVSSVFHTGNMVYVLITPDDKSMYIETSEGEGCNEDYYKSTSFTSEEVMESEYLLDDDNIGLPMLITIEKNVSIFDVSGNTMFFVKASKVRRDPDPKAPRYTRVLPNQTLTGTIFCPEDTKTDNTYMVMKNKKQIEIIPRLMGGYQDFSYYCEVTGEITIEGEFFIENGMVTYFRTFTNPTNI